jgi:cytidylate kinase
VTEGRSTLVVAIDGPAGSGKSTVARAVARALGLRYLDTGSLYRAVTRRVLDAGIDPADSEAVAERARAVELSVDTGPDAPAVQADGLDLTTAVRSPEVTAAVSAVSAVPQVREHLLAVQRKVIGDGGIVVEGRDIGTTVAPDAPIKVFLTAKPEIRAHRRTLESTSSPDAGALLTVEADLRRRDAHDAGRSTSPLTKAPDAVEIDTTELPVDKVVARIVDLAAAVPADPEEPTQHTRAVIYDGEPGTPFVRSVAHPHRWVMRLCRVIGRVLFPLVFRMRVVGRDNVPAAGPVIIAGNHTGFLDGPTVFATARRMPYFLVKAEMYTGGPYARLLDWLGQIPINRGRPDRTALRRGLGVLTDGHPLGMFPEGSRGSGDLESVQHGIAYLALRAGCPIVPVACFGTGDANFAGRRRLRRARVDVDYGAPFRITGTADPRSRRAVAEAAEEIRRQLVSHLAAAAARAGRAP